jgi:N-ethylmaleimide reductase
MGFSALLYVVFLRYKGVTTFKSTAMWLGLRSLTKKSKHMKLLQPYRLGKFELKNRMVLAPMTRSRAHDEGVVGKSTATYYAQRASAGLLISEAINISPQALGMPSTPGIFTDAQVHGWKEVTDAVHAEGSVMFAQLWHTGRVGHSRVKGGALPVAPSAISIAGQEHFTPSGAMPYETPKELSVEEIDQIILDFRQAARHALTAGFAGVELHAAFGYLPNQFLADSSNQRTDGYGGSTERRNRFVLEVMSALVEEVGSGAVGIRLSPTSTYNGMAHSAVHEQFSQLLQELDALDLAYVHLMNSPFNPADFPDYPANAVQAFSPLTRHPVIANGGFTRETAEAELEQNGVDLISFGRLFLANPDLPRRFEVDAPLNTADPTTFYGGHEKGYTDYPFYKKQ